MNIKYFKRTFIVIIIFLIISGVYIIYIKDNDSEKNIQAKNKEKKTTKEISIGITEFDTINPILTKSLEVQHITKLIYEPLVRITQDFNVEPGLAEEWSKINETTYIVKLDKEKTWQNGAKIKVEDIEFTIQTIKESDSIYNENVKKIKQIEKIDDTTFKIYLTEETLFFEYLLCFPIVQKETYNQEIPIGIGNFKIQKLDKEEIILQGKETKLTIKIYKTVAELYNEFSRENIDLIITQNTNYAEYIGKIGYEEEIITGREFYYISCENIENREIRKYINNNINKEKIIYDLYNKKYVIVNFPLGYGSYLNKESKTSQQTNNSKKIRITLSTTQDTEMKAIAEKIKYELQEKNIEIVLQFYTNKNADMILKKQTVPVIPMIHEYFKNEETKANIKEIYKIENKEIMKQEYEKIIDKYNEEMPFISLYFNSYIILHSEKLKGDFSGNWYNMFYNIDSWYKVI